MQYNLDAIILMIIGKISKSQIKKVHDKVDNRNIWPDKSTAVKYVRRT